MWPSIRDFFKNFFGNKAYFEAKWDRWVTKVRFALMSVGAAIAVPGPFQEAVKVLAPSKHAPYAGVVLMGLGVLLRAGDKTPAAVKDLAARMNAGGAPEP